jgi:hypothetical protein
MKNEKYFVENEKNNTVEYKANKQTKSSGEQTKHISKCRKIYKREKDGKGLNS